MRRERLLRLKVKFQTVFSIKALIRETVEETLEDFFDDPDEGQKVREEVKQQLLKSLKRTQAGERGIPAEEVYKKLNQKLLLFTLVGIDEKFIINSHS